MLPVFVIAVVLGGGCATTDEPQDLAPGERPAIHTDEAGLWMLSDKYEQSVISSGRLEKDSVLNDYVAAIVCRIAPLICSDIRTYVVDTPHFNATMSPNGFMQVWTGLLLRADNEAQLAYMLGHEVSHYVRRHSINIWRDYRKKSGVLAYFTLVTALGGGGCSSNLAQLLALSSVFAFSREQEREADDLGLNRMIAAGYDPHQAVRIWESLELERQAEDDEEPSIFFATHPSTRERVALLHERARAGRGKIRPPLRDASEFLALTEANRFKWLRDEVRLRRFNATEVLLKRLLARGDSPGEVHFFLGEVYRLSGADANRRKAVESYIAAIDAGKAPVETHRSLGLVYRKLGEGELARRSFQDYLAMAADADDHDMVETYLKDI
ncbi:MAG: M48 family metalloprotease [Gammaproteobacteria bacterium]|nr:M48 family metalloprotease [Gammaproteobacteria bacterium]